MAEENTDDFNEEKEAAEAEAAAKLEAEENEEDEGGKEEEEEGEGKEKEEEDDPDEEIHTRKSKKDYIIERKDKKIAKLKEKEENKEKETDDEEDDEDDAILSKEDKGAIEKVVDKRNAPILEALKTQADKDEMKAVISKFPEAKAMEKRITKYSNHPAYQNVPMENIYLMLAGQKNNLQSKKEDAKKEDKKNETGGHTKRAKKGAEPDYANMSDEEIEETDKKLMTGQL